MMAMVDEEKSAKYLIQDRQMSVVGATDRAGKWLSRVSYGPFGEADNPSASSRDYYYYGGRPVLGKTGLVDNRFRFYRPDLGRFLTRDLLPGHAYVYVSNNPLRYTDPLGLSEDGVSSLWGGLPNILGGASRYIQAAAKRNQIQIAAAKNPLKSDLAEALTKAKQVEESAKQKMLKSAQT